LIAGLAICAITFAVFASALSLDRFDGVYQNDTSDMNTFNSFEEIQEYVNQKPKDGGYSNPKSDRKNTISLAQTAFESAPDSSDAGGSDYSSTNIQVQGVDEGDIVKNDGNFAYIVSKNKTKVYILDVYPAHEAKVISEVEVNFTIQEIYLNNDKLIILGTPIRNYNHYYYEMDYDYGYSYSWEPQVNLRVFDITSRNFPVLSRTDDIDGNYINSRMIGDHFYIIATQGVGKLESEEDLPAPPNKIYHLSNTTDNYYTFTNIVSMNVHKPREDIESMFVLMGSSSNIYVSTKNIYITCWKSAAANLDYRWGTVNVEYTEETLVARISINNGYIKSESSGSVPGRILNRFSMDEHKGYFRIATTTGHVSKRDEASSMNHVFILNMNMKIVGQVVDIAPGERIYSARFMGDRGYIVTFKKVDPFFVIDLSNPYEPEILGELKIPGYSDYLHPYDENHVIGLGKDTEEAQSGNFAWYQGVKLALFDVTDVRNPKEKSKMIIGDRGTNSDALYDSHAFLFDKEKELLVIPIQLVEDDVEKIPEGASTSNNNRRGYVWNGVYVLDISANSGISLRGTVTHNDDDVDDDNNYYYSGYQNNIKRSFYIDDALYTVSDNLLKANELSDLDYISEVELDD
jgi:uncharacterized secreted protein with C-terminal beta-propeller domain